MKDKYRKQVALLLRIMPSVYRIREFAVHGGTAINLFYKNMPRYSVDIDITYIPIQDRQTSIKAINARLDELKKNIEKVIPGIVITHKPEILKLLCRLNDASVKIEVNGTKRGIIGQTLDIPLCDKAKQEFSMTCKARIVSIGQLCGGKITAALSRQHPRDMFDCKFMNISSFSEIKDGFMLCLLGSDKPIVESLWPNEVDQTSALTRQFEGMSDIPFSYDDYKQTRIDLIKMVQDGLTAQDKEFLLSFEAGAPKWELCSAGDFSSFPAVQWEMLNIRKLVLTNPNKLEQNVRKLSVLFSL